ncbi:MAG TPA: NADH-quinone oxidoreductase subunit NuoG [Bryobacteraceae bacterium]|jgi:NADH-quinone oxidoreductase subunit G|nr:NADH-quinone oxidoreductase subunit NuoG [Bryobacteraceae bacterium]
MPDLVTLTIDGRTIQAPPGTLLIDAAKRSGIEVPSFCYYEGLTLAAACRMCLVEIEKMPKLMTACTQPVAEGMVVRTETPQVAAARKSMLEFLLANHPLDCPVCDKGGECELQDMTFRYGAGESRFTEMKVHVDEKQWSPVVFFDNPRCILCYRCVRICNEGMGVGALGVVNRGVVSEIAPNKGDHLECDECGMCIDICPVGALTSGIYRYHTRPWEMQHVGTICTHCSNGCKTTLGVRNDEIIRGNNRDHSGVNGEFLCIKGRYAFDFYNHPERLLAPLVRVNGTLEEVSWSKAIETVAAKFNEVRGRNGKVGVIGSNHTTNEENYYLQKFARQVLGTENIDHHRTGDVPNLLDALSGKTGKLATTADLYEKKAVLVVGTDLALEQPFLSFQVRANYRHHQAHVYVVTAQPVREDQYAAASPRVAAGGELDAVESLRDRLQAEPELVVVFGDAIKGEAVRRLVDFGESLGIPVHYVCLVDYSNSRGAVDMGLLPDAAGGLALPEILAAQDLDVLWVVGANPLRGRSPAPAWGGRFVVVHDLFLTETAQAADVVFPAASAYEKGGTVTNVCGEVQRLRKAVGAMGAKPDLEIMGLLAREMGVAAEMGPWIPDTVFTEIRKNVRGYDVPLPVLEMGGAAQTAAVNGRVALDGRPELIRSAHENLFTSGTLGRYSKVLNSVVENHGNR